MVNGTQGRIFSHLASCFAITLDGNVSNDYAGYRFSFKSQCWRELEPVSEELDLATLATGWHNVEAGCRQYKLITTFPTRHPLVYDTVYMFFSASDNLTTDNTLSD